LPDKATIAISAIEDSHYKDQRINCEFDEDMTKIRAPHLRTRLHWRRECERLLSLHGYGFIILFRVEHRVRLRHELRP